MLFKNGSLFVNKDFSPLKIEQYSDKKHLDFKKLFTDSISCRLSEKGTNWLMASSGWDSTIILDTLLKLTDNKNVNTVTFEVQFRDGQVLNCFEIEKIKEISDYHNVKNHRFLVDMND